jgi:hypothetical protein
MLVAVELLYVTLVKWEIKENGRALVTSQNIRCEGRGYKDVY